MYIPAPAPTPNVYAEIKQAVTPEGCTRTLGPIVIGAQVYDLLNTAKYFNSHPTSYETDWWNKRFAGPSGRNIVGIGIGMAVLDAIKLALTRHNPVLRCGVMIDQIRTNVKAIITTNKER